MPASVQVRGILLYFLNLIYVLSLLYPRPVFCEARPAPRAEIPWHCNAYYQVRRIVMSARSTFIHLAGKAGILFGALFLVSVLLAAIPGHHAPVAPEQESQQSSGAQPQESQPM